MKTFYNNLNQIFTEDFLVKHIKIGQVNKKYLEYSLKPEEIKIILMKGPEFLSNIDNAIEYLIRSNDISTNEPVKPPIFSDAQLSFETLQKKLMKLRILSQNRILNSISAQTESTFSVKKLESVLIKGKPGYFGETLIYSYSALIMISKSSYDIKGFINAKNFDLLNQLIFFYRSYSLQSNFSPVNIKLLKPPIEENNDFNPLFTGIPSGSSNIHRNGIASNGHFLIVLHSDMRISIFPISSENGGFLSPFMCKLIFTSPPEKASLSFLSDSLIVTSNQYISNYKLSSLIENQSKSKCPEIQTKAQIINKEYSIVITDGVINVYLNRDKEMISATIKSVDSQREINQVILQKNKNKIYPFDNSMLQWPVETNGLVLSFYIRIDRDHTLCRQFSLIDGTHLIDEIIETNINILAITYDSINQMHYVAVEQYGQLMIRAIDSSSDCSLNPYIFGFSAPDLNEKVDLKTKIFSIFKEGPKFTKDDDELKYEKEFVCLFSSILFSSIFFKKDIETFIIEGSENVLLLPLFIIEIANLMNQNESIKSIMVNNIQLLTIQAISILFVINTRHVLKNREYLKEQNQNQICIKIEAAIIDFLMELSRINQSFSMNIISFVILNLFDLIDIVGNSDNSFQCQLILEGLLISCSSTLLNYTIHVLYNNSEKFSTFSFSNLNNPFNKYIIDSYRLSNCHPNIISFLICHQRCLINQVHKSIEKDHFSQYSLIINIKYNDCKTDNESLNNFGEYTNFLINQVLNSMTNSSSFEVFQDTMAYFLFSNFLSLISGLFNFNEIAQIVSPLLFITQNSIKEFFERKKVNVSKNIEAQNILMKIGMAFGAFTGTLIKGGNYSDFDEKYKWLIRPNMNLISRPDLLNELDNPNTNVKTFLDSNSQLFIQNDPSLNGKQILQKIYKKWNFNMNKNLKSPLLELDQLFFAVELYHLQLFDELKQENIEKLRPALQQMMRVRNTARAILRSNDSTRTIPILFESNNDNDSNVNNIKENTATDDTNVNYSPFDLIVVKCKMLLRMKSKFDNYQTAPKLLADFVLSSDQPSIYINYISNQQNRLELTNIGFSLIKAAYSLQINEIFLQVIDTTLSIVVDNFDGLSAIIQYDSSHKSEENISEFLLRALKTMESPNLALVVYKLMKSEALSSEIIGKSIELVLSDSISNNKLFGLCYRRFGYISNIFTDSNTFLFLDSEKDKKVPLISLPSKDFDKITLKQWFIISDVLLIQKCDVSIYQKILNFFLNFDFHNNNQILQFVSQSIFSFYEKFDDSYSLENVKKDFNLLLNSLSKSLINNVNLERASEIITFFRKILALFNKLTLVLNEIFKSYEVLLNQNKDIDSPDFKEKVLAIFAILGGFVDVFKTNYPVSFRIDRENVSQGIFLCQSSILKYPIDEETKPILINNIQFYPEPLIPFNWCMFPNFNFILSFLYYATDDVSNQICFVYLNSLSYYLKEESFYSSLLDEHIEYLIAKFSTLMNPFDDIKNNQNIISILMDKKKTSPLKNCKFSIMSNKYFNCTTYLSPILKLSNTNVSIEFNQVFNGYLGLVADCPLEKNYPYAIINFKTGVVYPGIIGSKIKKTEFNKSNKINFSVDAARQMFILDKATIKIPQDSSRFYKFRIFICVFNPCEVKSIDTNLNDFDLKYKPRPSSDYYYNKMSNFLQFPIWTKYKTESQLKNLLLDEVNSNFQPLTTVNLDDSPLFEMIDFRYLLFHFYQAEVISEDYINSIIDHAYSKLVTQISTIVMMYLVNNGYGTFLFNYKPIYLIKLFSYCQIPLEPYDNEKLVNIDFPFLFNESILNENSLVVYNQQFNNLEIDMKNCLHIISNIYKDRTFIVAFKTYIDDMGNDPKVHLCRNSNLDISFYDLVYLGSTLIINSQYNNSKALIVSTPYFNNFRINTIESVTLTSSSIIHFPFIFDTNDNKSASIQINITKIKNDKKTILALSIDKYSNHWVFGTPFELLLLLKEYYMLTQDTVFIRKKLVEWILIDSPFINFLLPKILIQCSQESFISPSNVNIDYLQRLLCLSSLINCYNNDQNFDQDLSIFLFQEKRSLNSNLQSKIAPFFPEFYSKEQIDHSSFKSSNKIISINLPDLDIPHKISHPMSTFMLCKTFIAKRESIRGYPYWELLPIWLSISVKYCKRKENKKIKKDNGDDEVLVIKKPNGFFEVVNPLRLKCFVYINPLIRNRIQTNLNSCIIVSKTSTFADPTAIINYQNVFDPIEVNGQVLYLSLNDIEGPVEFIVDVEKEEEEKEVTKANVLYEFNPSLIHDDFVNEINMLINQWTDEETSEILSSIPPFLFQQKSFSPISEIVLSADMSFNSYFPPRVVLIVSYIVHRINYLHFSRRKSISDRLWISVNHLISFDEASKQFLNSIARKKTSRIYVNINRFEAHRMSIELNGNQDRSIICQMSKVMALAPTSLRSPEMLWHVKFINEDAIDVGGPSRELFAEISQSIFEPTSGLFIISPNGRMKYGSRYRDVYVPYRPILPQRSRIVEMDSLQRNLCYKAIGCFLGIVMRTGFYQDLPFAPIVWKLIAGERVNFKDVLEIDQRLNDFFSQLRRAARNKDVTVYEEQFNSRSNRLLWFCENWDGSSIKINNPTKSINVRREDVNIYIANCIKKRIETLYENIIFIRKGMCENIGFNRHQFMSGKIISFLSQGSNVITTDQLKKIFVFPSDEELKVGSKGYIYFWEAVERMNNKQRSLLLKFITALTRLPNPATFKDFSIKVSPLSGSKINYLPQASTCFNTLYLPEYTTPDIAYRMITTAIESCQTMDKT